MEPEHPSVEIDPISFRRDGQGLLAATIALAMVAACSASQADGNDSSLPQVLRIPVTIDSEKGAIVFQAEIADSPEERSRGLMFRKALGRKEGMLFLFPSERHQSFWMRNTLIPLDMIFIRADRTILGIVENAVPETDTSRSVPGESQFVLEINGGVSGTEGIRTGQTVSFFAPVPES